MTFYFYPTDCLFLLCVTGLLAFAVHVRRDRALRERWLHALRAPLAGGAAVVVVLYFAIAVLDSIRIEHNAARDSLLDLLLAPLKAHVETSYSAPFAAFGYVKESIVTVDGTVQRDFPRLRFGGRHLADPAARAGDLCRRVMGAIAAGVTLWWVGLWLMRRCSARFRRYAWRELVGRESLAVVGMSSVGLGCLIVVAPYYHVFGTDKVGNDVLFQALKGIRTGLVLCTVTTLITLPLAVVLGIAAGLCRGWIDDAIQYVYTTLASIPGVLLIAAAALTLDVQLARYTSMASAELRADFKLLALCGVLGLTGWTSLCRLLRAEVLKLRAVEFVTAAQALGVDGLSIAWRHLVPNTLHLVIIATVLDFSSLVLAEAVLTYIDIGVDPNMDSWGNMINSARLDLAREPSVWWSLAAAGAFMFVLVLAVNVLADAVRDAFDPRLRVLPRREVER